MLQTALFYLFIAVGTINLIHFAFYLIGANWYDVQTFQARSKGRLIKRIRSRNPLVSVLIPAYNEALVIERCLESIRKNSYQKLEVIVNNDASEDDTAAIVRAYKKKYPKFNLRLVSRRRNGGKAAGLNYIARNYAKGELIMSLDADSLLHQEAIKRAVHYFDDSKVAGVAANVRIIEEPTVLGVLQRFEHMIGYRSKKFYAVTNCELIVGGVASTYRRELIKQVGYYDNDTATEDIGLSMKIAALGNKQHRLIYASDVVAMTEGVSDIRGLLNQRYRWKLGNLQNIVKHRDLLFNSDPKYTRSLTWYRVPMAFVGEIMVLLEPIVFAFVLYLSIRFITPAMFMAAYTTITAYLLLSLWPDEHLDWKGKIKASAYIPFLYLIFYIMNFVQLLSAIKCIANHKKIVNLSAKEGAWISPRRIGRAVRVS
jgi:cellulose synthase/poly-beta-1,6-N-acetylglucosamine synthase-like glycosyltransferase